MCRVEGCDRDIRIKKHQLCNAHYQQMMDGKEFTPPLVHAPVEVRLWSRVQKTETCWLWTGSVQPTGYGQIHYNSANWTTHRLAYTLTNGPIPQGLEIDHICHVRHCINPDHLRLADRKQNAENHPGAQRNSKSGVRGVHWRKDIQRWSAEVRHNGVAHRLGCFDDIDVANSAVTELRNQLFTHNDLDRRAA